MATVNVSKLSGNAEPTVKVRIQSCYRVDSQYPAKITIAYKQNRSVVFYVTSGTANITFPNMPTYDPDTVRFTYAPDSYTEPTSSVKKGASGNNAYWVQTRLYELGYAIKVDGSFGQATLNCVKQFQIDNNLSVDGSVGPNTKAVLKTLWASKKATEGHTLPSHTYPGPANLWDDLPNSVSQTISVTVETYDFGGNADSGTSSLSFVLKEDNDTKPYVSGVSFTPVNTGLPSKFNGIAIQGVSTYTATAVFFGKYGANVKSAGLYVEENGDDYYYTLEPGSEPTEQVTFPVGVINQTGNPHITVTDIANTREFERIYGEHNQITVSNITVKAYEKPYITGLKAYRVDPDYPTVAKRDGTSVRIERTLHKSTFGLDNNDNLVHLEYRYKAYNSNVWSDWINMHSDYVTPRSVTFDKIATYNLEIKAVDNVTPTDNSIVYSLIIPPEDIPLHLGAGGKKIAIGTYCTDIDNIDGDRTFLCDWKAVFNQLVKMKNGLNVTGTAQATTFEGDIKTNNLKINNQTVADYVVREWDSWEWHCRTWASGLTEAWMTATISGNITKDQGNHGYGYTESEHFIKFPELYGMYPNTHPIPDDLKYALSIETGIVANNWLFVLVRDFTTGTEAGTTYNKMRVRLCGTEAQNSVSADVTIKISGVLVPQEE